VFGTEQTFKIVVTIGYYGGHTTEYELNIFAFVEKVDDPAMYLSLYGVLWSLGIQYK
jgi:hypothetical protein